MDNWTVIVEQLIGLVESTAPALWEMAQRQVIANAIEMAFWAVLLSALAPVCWKLARKWYKKLLECSRSDEDMYGFGMVTAYLVFFIAAVIAPIMAVGAMKRFVNPSFYALKLLIQMAAR